MNIYYLWLWCHLQVSLLNSLLDTSEIVIHYSLQSLISLAELRMLSKHRMKSIVQVVVSLLCHPSVWVRTSIYLWFILGVCGLLSCIATVLPIVDVHFIIYPLVRRHLKFDISEISIENLEKAVKSPLDRELYQEAVSFVAAHNITSKRDMCDDSFNVNQEKFDNTEE